MSSLYTSVTTTYNYDIKIEHCFLHNSSLKSAFNLI